MFFIDYSLPWYSRYLFFFDAPYRYAWRHLLYYFQDKIIKKRTKVALFSQKERMARLLNTLNVRAQADRKRLPQLEEEAATAQSGEPYVRLGELYYGFGDYAHTITAIQRGLDKGKVVHLDEAYVYLGLSEQAVGDLEEARKAFAKLKDVPGISPRVLLLWTLYAETQL